MQAPGFAGINIFAYWGMCIQSRTKDSGCYPSLVMSGHQGADVHSGMTSVPYSWPWSICLSTHGIRYGGGKHPVVFPCPRESKCVAAFSTGVKPATAETRNLACLEGREPVDSVGAPTKDNKNI